jgi:ABC-type glycerol-3-phosphate transport system permease component
MSTGMACLVTVGVSMLNGYPLLKSRFVIMSMLMVLFMLSHRLP